MQQGLRVAQAKQREDEITKMAIVAKAERTELMAKKMKEKEERFEDVGSERPARRRSRSTKKSVSGKSSSADSETSSQRRRNRRRRNEKRAKEEDAIKERDKIKAQRKREIVREDRMERAGLRSTKIQRDGNRDISEKIALGQAQPSSKEAMFDQRLFNQNAGLGTGFGHDEDYNLYDKPLFADRTAASIYKNVKNIDVDNYVNNEDDAEGQQSRVRKVLGQQGNKDQGDFDGIKSGYDESSKTGA